MPTSPFKSLSLQGRVLQKVFILILYIMRLYKCLIGLMLSLLYVGSLYAQDVKVKEPEGRQSYQRVYIVDLGLGVGFPGLLGDGNSSWHTGKSQGRTAFTSSVQLMTYSPRSNIGYGLLYYAYPNSGTKNYDGVMASEMSEKTSFYYVAPQISLIKRQLGFPDGIMYVNAGVGYANFKSQGLMLQKEEYKTTRSAVGCNIGIAYEYAFDPRLGIRLAVNCVYARIKGLHKDKGGYPNELSIAPRSNLHLFVPSLELGLSYYMVHW